MSCEADGTHVTHGNYSMHLPHKLYSRQIYGCNKTRRKLQQFRYFETCPDNLQIPLAKILDQKISSKGHVSVGFSPDGKYLMSYQCEIRFQAVSEPVSFKYSLHFWLFDLWNPLKKIREVQLFGEETILHGLHILVCQPPDCDYMVIHGCAYNVDSLSSGKQSYVSIIPTADATMLNYCTHLRYELLPPHPPFITSVCLKLTNVVLLNSGDMLFAILLNDEKLFSPKNTNADSPMCYCSSRHCGGDISNVNEYTYNNNISDSGKTFAVDDLQQEKLSTNTFHDDSRHLYTLNDNETISTNLSEHGGNASADTLYDSGSEELPVHSSMNVGDGLSMNSEYVSFVMQGYSIPNNVESQESLPSSPFDCTATVMPAGISSVDGDETLKLTYEHRCYRSSNKGNKVRCDYFLCQAQFDAENFVNEEIQLCPSINKRFVSMRDYDMQIVEVCQATNEVVILINALVVLRDRVHRSDQKCHAASPPHRREKYYKLVLYTLGYTVSWSVYTGHVKVLKRYPLAEGPGTLCKTRQFSPSLGQAVQLRKSFFIPTAKRACVQTLSNHTVFSGNSLQYLFNPVLPVAVVR